MHFLKKICDFHRNLYEFFQILKIFMILAIFMIFIVLTELPMLTQSFAEKGAFKFPVSNNLRVNR